MIAKVNIQAIYKNGITCLGEIYFSPPFKIANITEDKKAAPLELMLMNSSPGTLDGDWYEMNIRIEENACLHLQTQSYQRLFNMKKGATQSMEIKLGKNSSFIYLHHPAVPHEQSIFTSINKIYLSDESKLIWGEVLTCGRKLNGEIFLFSKYHTITEVYINDKLVIKENLLMQPAIINPALLGQLERFTHQASLICFNEKNVTDQLDEVHEFLSSQKEILAGVTTTGGDGMMIRILGQGAEQLHQLLQSISFLLQQKIISKPTTNRHAY